MCAKLLYFLFNVAVMQPLYVYMSFHGPIGCSDPQKVNGIGKLVKAFNFNNVLKGVLTALNPCYNKPWADNFVTDHW